MLPKPKMGLIFLWCNRGVATGGRRAEGPYSPFLPQPPLPSLLQFSNQFQFQTSGILLVLRNYTDQKFHDFNCLCYNFYQFTAAFHFFKLHRRNRSLRVRTSKKDQYLTLYRPMPVQIFCFIMFFITTMKKHYFILFYITFVLTIQKGPSLNLHPSPPSPLFVVTLLCNQKNH